MGADGWWRDAALRWTGAGLLLTALTVAHTWPLASLAASHLFATADTTAGAWSSYGLARQLLADPTRPFDGNNLYPYDDTLAVLDHQLGNMPLSVPLAAAGVDVVLAFNLTLLAGFVLTGVATAALTRHLSGSTAAGLVAGCAFAFGAYRVQGLLQPHLLITFGVPVALLALHRFSERPTIGRWGLLAASALLVALSSWHVAILGAAAIGVLATILLLSSRDAVGRRVAGLVLVATVAAAALAPLAVTYMRVGERWPPRTGEGRETVGTLVNHSTDLKGLLAMPIPAAAAYADWLPVASGTRPGAFPGVVTMLLAAIALAALGRSRPGGRGAAARAARWGLGGAVALALASVVAALAGSPAGILLGALRSISPFALLGIAVAAAAVVAARAAAVHRPALVPVIAYATLAAVGALMALGPVVTLDGIDMGSGVNRLELLPVRLIMRAPARFILLSSLGLAVLAGLGVARLLARQGGARRVALAACLLLLVNLDLVFKVPALNAVSPPSEADRWLAESAEPGAVVDYPLVNNYWAIVASQRYRRPIVNGAGYLGPPALWRLESLPDFSEEQIDVLLAYLHPRYVVVRTGLYEPEARAAVLAALQAQRNFLMPVVRRGDDLVFELRDRAHGPALQRAWPRRRLQDASGTFEIDGRITEGRAGTVGELVVELNGRPLLSVPGDEAEQRGTWLAHYDRSLLIDGDNVLELRGGYRFAEAAPGMPVGDTGRSLAADVSLVAESHQLWIEVNGRRLGSGPGSLVVVMDPSSGEISAHDFFDLQRDPGARDALLQFLADVAEGDAILLAGWAGEDRGLDCRCDRALAAFGLAVGDSSSGAIVAVGIRGAAAGTALQVVDEASASLTLGAPERRRVQLFSLQLR